MALPSESGDSRRSLPTGAELDILAIVWRLGPCTVRDVHETVAQALAKETTYTTTLKQMQVMTEKGLLKRAEKFRTHVYEAVAPKEQTQSQIMGDLIRRAFEGSAKDLVLGALSSQLSTPEDLAEIRRMLDAKSPGAPDAAGHDPKQHGGKSK